MKESKTLSDNERYYWHASMARPGLPIIVTMVKELISFIHVANEIVVDFTFKRTPKDVNEWEVTIWLDKYQQREYLSFVLLFTHSYSLSLNRMHNCPGLFKCHQFGGLPSPLATILQCCKGCDWLTYQISTFAWKGFNSSCS
jgi:hypothetical protein